MTRFLKLPQRLLSICLALVISLAFLGTASQAQAACVATQPGGLSGKIVVTGCAAGETAPGQDARGPAPAGVTNDGGCVGYSQNQTNNRYGNGEYTPSPRTGECHQIDITTTNGQFGVAKYGGGGAGGGGKVCGESCTTTADCIKNSGTGAPVACVAGKCANTACAAGMTIPGLNCTCGANARLCGQTCSGALGLCAAGQGTCTYVNGPNCGWGTTTYCTRPANGYKQVACTAGDAPGGHYLVTPSGKSAALTPAEIAGSCQVCGNGDQEGNEQCDHGANNGKPGDMCTIDCKKVVACNDLCQSEADCGAPSHVVKLVFHLYSSGQSMVVDYIKDGITTVDDNSALLTYEGTWAKSASNTPYGGQYAYTVLPNSSVSYKTYSSTITLRTYQYVTRGGIDVYVDGVLKQSFNELNQGSAWVDLPITVSTTPNKYTCTPVGDTRKCRLTSNPQDQYCGVVASVPPTPSPVSSPTSLICDLTPNFSSTGNSANWKYGDMITFAVGALPSARIPTGGSARYEGEVKAYRGTTAVKTVQLVPINATASIFQPMKIDVANSIYYFRFRYCVKTSAGVETCSNWGAWAAP